MSWRAQLPVVLSPEEERAVRTEAQASALETLRTTHPDLFALRVSAEDPGAHLLRTRFNVDVTEDNLLSVLLRPHAKRIFDSLAPHGRKEKPQDFMYFIVKGAFDNLDIDIEDLRKIGVDFGCRHECTDETYIGGYISYLREALFNLHKLKKWTKILADRKLGEEYNRREAARRAPVSEMEAARRAVERRRMEQLIERQRLAADAKAERYEGALRRRVEQMAAVRAARGPRPPPEENLLGLHSAAAAASAGENIDYMNIERKREIAANLESIFRGGVRKQKTRKHRRARKSQKSRRQSRK
jgi:hypothetical protein